MSDAEVRTPLRQRLARFSRGPLTFAVWLGAALLCAWLLGRRASRWEAVGLARAVECEVSSAVAGRIQNVLVDLLDDVEPGQPIAVLDPAGLEARIETAAAAAAQLGAELDALRAELSAGERGARAQELDELRRLAVDEEQLRLDALAIAVEIEADRVERERLELHAARVRALSEQKFVPASDLDDARLSLDRVAVRIRENEVRLAETRDALARAGRRRSEFAEVGAAAPPPDAALRALGELIRVEELRLRELEVEREGLVLRAPVHGTVQKLLGSTGQAVVPGEPVAVVVARTSPEVLAYLPDGADLEVRAGERVLVSRRRPPWSIVECVVVRVGAAVEILPQQLWRSAAQPEYGLPLLARGAQDLDLLPGEAVAVRIAR